MACRVVSTTLTALAIIFSIIVIAPRSTRADENGVSFWLPGIFGSLAATPQQPGWSLPSSSRGGLGL